MLVKLKDKKCVGVLGTCLDKVYGNPHSLDQVRDSVPHTVHSRGVDRGSCGYRLPMVLFIIAVVQAPKI